MSNFKFLILNKIYLIGFCLVVTLPLLNLQPWFSPPDWGKTIVFRIVLSILIFLFLWQLTSDRDQEVKEKISFLLSKKNMIFWLIVSLLAINLLATIFSLDPNFSLWGSPYRSGGFINFAFCIIFGLLAFLISEKGDWQKVWNVAIITGVLVSLVAIFQWQGLFKDILITFEARPPSSLGNPIMLALYLLLLSFLTLSFALKANPWYKKIPYLAALLAFLFTISLTYSRAAYLGLAVGFLYFILTFPFQKRAASLILKLSFLAVIVLGICGVYCINTQPQLPEFVQQNKMLKGVASRLLVERALQDPRLSGWEVSWQALKDRPILGYGPENFAIGFDRYYDPSLRGIEKMPGSSDNWWDRAHNFIFDISVTAGIPALIIFLALLGTIFWRLRKLKPNITAHSIQATLIGYLVANFFSFDTFSIYLILFLLIGFSLHLIYNSERENQDG